MKLMIHQDDPSPLRVDEASGGVVRIGPSRVTLSVFMRSFELGFSAEGIVAQFPSVGLTDAYATLGYYFRHRDEVDAYLRSVRTEEEKVIAEVKARQEADGFWERLKARQRARMQSG